MNRLAFALILWTVFNGCKEKDTNDTEAEYFPASAYIKSQVAHIDTSLFSIIKIVQRDTVADTTYLKREDFKKEAADFLALPDLASKKLKDDYEETKQFDEALQKITFMYVPKDNSRQEIQKEVIIVKPDPNIDKVETIFIDWMQEIDDGTMQKIMTWEANKLFRTITIIQKKGQPDKTERVEVRWQDPSAE
jgi:hypothetical protein